MPTKLSETEIAHALGELPHWAYRDGAIRRTYTTDGWPHTMLVVNAVAYVAEAWNHHPDLHVTWSKVEVAFWTHSAGGITRLDIETAARVEQAIGTGGGVMTK